VVLSDLNTVFTFLSLCVFNRLYTVIYMYIYLYIYVYVYKELVLFLYSVFRIRVVYILLVSVLQDVPTWVHDIPVMTRVIGCYGMAGQAIFRRKKKVLL
jgi:hypothetical protein